jgi:hypothetical protein
LNETVKFVEIKEPAKDKAPYKLLDGNGREVATWDAAAVSVVRQHLNQPLLADISVVTKGQYTNTYLTKDTVPQIPPAPAKNGWQPKSPEERREIIRQTALKAAVELFGALYHGKGKESSLSTKPVLKTAEIFADWVQRTQTDPESPVPDEVPW